MIEKNYTAYLIPTSDYHSSEYISDYFKLREFFTGFNGSMGTLLVMQNNAYLWVDGRYFIQAAKQIDDKIITLMKMGTPNTPTLTEFLANNLNPKDTLAFDGKLLNTKTVIDIIKSIKNGINIVNDENIIDSLWPERPKLPFSLLFTLDDFYTGKAYKEKLQQILDKLKENNAEYYLLASLEDQAWLYNLRASDVLHTPVFLAFSLISNNSTILFVDTKKIDINVAKYLENNEIILKPYNEIYNYIKNLKAKNILINYDKVNYALYSIIKNTGISIISKDDPTLLLKAIKNETEIENTKIAHIKDGLCVFRTMNYIKKNYENNDLSELGIGNYIENLRKETEGFIDISFDSICGFNEHGAMMHYKATPDSSSKIKNNGLVLLDSGGHYFEGTTDITRTFSIGKINDKMKIHYTTVLKSVIALSKAIFLKGCTGFNLDALAREPIWQLLIDYKCGTGHGVGNILSVHEGPNNFRWQIRNSNLDSQVLLPGMITTVEPGIYLENKYGIRIENELLCVEKETNEFGTFLGFETITYAPIDLDPIKPSLLTKEEKEWINEYHKMVYEKLRPYLDKTELDALALYTRKI